MSVVANTVLANFPDEPTARECEEWLLAGHLRAVLAGGAVEAQVVRLHGSAPQLEVRYLFPNQQVFDRYVAEVAPALRAESLARFPAERGVRFERRSGIVLAGPTSNPRLSIP